MPSKFNTIFLRLKDDDEFEELLRDICALEWHDSGTKRYGRSGQKQSGVDIYGQPAWLKGKFYGVQCKLRSSQKQLTEAEIEHEVKEARSFPKKLLRLIIATDTPRDTYTQILVDTISEREVGSGGFAVEIWFWPEIERKIATYPRVLAKYYHDHLTSLTNAETLVRLIDRPLQILSLKPSSLIHTVSLDQRLKFRGIQIADGLFSPIEAKATDYHDLLPDGIFCQLDTAVDNETNPSLNQLLLDILSVEKLVEPTCPIFIVLPIASQKHFLKSLHDLHKQPDRFQLLTSDLDLNEIADRVFTAVFEYGYKRRGTIPTINMSARSTPNRPVSALLDLDWCSHFSTESRPTQSEWEQLFVPALKTVVNRLTGLKEATQILADSEFFLPASVALGFHLNLRVAILGVWARWIGKSDIKQLWLTDGEPGGIEVVETWYEEQENDTCTAILELSIGYSIHAPVKAFVEQQGLTADIWLQAYLPVEKDEGEPIGINEAQAIAYANYIGNLMRKLTERGVTDTHLFLRLPTALGVLVGQKVQACGRLHFYWFDYKKYSYKYAFMLA
jgi:hypothetical protein